MASESLPLIDVARLQLGMYIVLDVGWRNHPFVRSSFTLKTAEQLAQLRSLGLREVHYCPERSLSTPLPVATESPPPMQLVAAAPATPALAPMAPEDPVRAALRQVELRYRESAGQHQRLLKLAQSDPQQAGTLARELSHSLLSWIADSREVAIRLLAQQADGPSGHELGVAALAMLLGRDCGLQANELHELTTAALLHDIGKLRVPSFLHEDHGRLTEFERRSYRRHVEFGVELATAMGISQACLTAIAEHHERYDGGGFPAARSGDALSPAGRVLAIVNRYQNLVCPLRVEAGLTPHRALQTMYREEHDHFDPMMLNRFVRIMGVYPPGTLVELSDQRMAIVIASQPRMTLAPRVQIVDPAGPGSDGPELDLDPTGGLGVRSAMQPEHLSQRWALRARQLARAAYFLQPLRQDQRAAA